MYRLASGKLTDPMGRALGPSDPSMICGATKPARFSLFSSRVIRSTKTFRPSPIERIESGPLSYGGGNDDNTNPFEVRLVKYLDLHSPDQVVGIKALRELHAAGIKRHQLDVKLDNQSPQAGHLQWFKGYKNGAYVGEMTNGCWSPRAETVIGFILVGVDVQPGERVEVHRDGNIDTGTVCEFPFF